MLLFSELFQQLHCNFWLVRIISVTLKVLESVASISKHMEPPKLFQACGNPRLVSNFRAGFAQRPQHAGRDFPPRSSPSATRTATSSSAKFARKLRCRTMPKLVRVPRPQSVQDRQSWTLVPVACQSHMQGEPPVSVEQDVLMGRLWLSVH